MVKKKPLLSKVPEKASIFLVRDSDGSIWHYDTLAKLTDAVERGEFSVDLADDDTFKAFAVAETPNVVLKFTPARHIACKVSVV